MITLDLLLIQKIIDADIYNYRDQINIENISTDSRVSTHQGLFFALPGDNFDGHDYIKPAITQGNIATVVNKCLKNLDIPQLVVKDVNIALGKLAAWLRAEMQAKKGLKILAITGSSGKTTVKEMSANIMQELGDTLYTQGNFNNEIGVPLTLLNLNKKHKYLVIELGANHIGEIAYTTRLANPDVALINNIYPAHIEGFGNIQGIVTAKSEIYQELKQEGYAIYNLDQPEYTNMVISQIKQPQSHIVSFSLINQQANFYAKEIEVSSKGSRFILVTPKGEIQITLSYLGEHNISNAIASASLTMQLGASLKNIKKGLEKKTIIKGRLMPIKVSDNLLLIDDTYNANLFSMQAAVDVLSKQQGIKIFVVADMKELGLNSADYHRQLAEYVQQKNLNFVLSYGQESAIISQKSQGKHYVNQEELCQDLQQIIQAQLLSKQVTLLAKGSNSMKMHNVISQIKDYFEC